MKDNLREVVIFNKAGSPIGRERLRINCGVLRPGLVFTAMRDKPSLPKIKLEFIKTVFYGGVRLVHAYKVKG
jgi:hypothetical protein